MPEKFSAQVFTPRCFCSCLMALTLGIHFGFGSRKIRRPKNNWSPFEKLIWKKAEWPFCAENDPIYAEKVPKSAHFVRISKAIRLSSGQSFLNFCRSPIILNHFADLLFKNVEVKLFWFLPLEILQTFVGVPYVALFNCKSPNIV